MHELFHGLNEASRARSDDEFVSKLGGALQEAAKANSGLSCFVRSVEFSMVKPRH
jgi:hypothetical protein